MNLPLFDVPRQKRFDVFHRLRSSYVIEIYSNRVEFSNPGEPIIPVEHFI